MTHRAGPIAAGLLAALLAAGCSGAVDQSDGETPASPGAGYTTAPAAPSTAPSTPTTAPERPHGHGGADGEGGPPPPPPDDLSEAVREAQSPPADDGAALRSLYSLRELARTDLRPLLPPRSWKKLEKAHAAIVRDAVTGELHGAELAADVRRYAELVERHAAAQGLL